MDFWTPRTTLTRTSASSSFSHTPSISATCIAFVYAQTMETHSSVHGHKCPLNIVRRSICLVSFNVSVQSVNKTFSMRNSEEMLRHMYVVHPWRMWDAFEKKTLLDLRCSVPHCAWAVSNAVCFFKKWALWIASSSIIEEFSLWSSRTMVLRSLAAVFIVRNIPIAVAWYNGSYEEGRRSRR